VEAIERLVAIEQITRLKAAYFRYMDTKDWQAFADQFTADATMDVSGETGGGVIEGRREIASFVRNAIGEVTTVHHGHMPEINIISPTEATGSGRWRTCCAGPTTHRYERCTAMATTTTRTRNSAIGGSSRRPSSRGCGST
jgi:hypothetical protein